MERKIFVASFLAPPSKFKRTKLKLKLSKSCSFREWSRFYCCKSYSVTESDTLWLVDCNKRGSTQNHIRLRSTIHSALQTARAARSMKRERSNKWMICSAQYAWAHSVLHEKIVCVLHTPMTSSSHCFSCSPLIFHLTRFLCITVNSSLDWSD